MAELVDALLSGSSAARRGGSSPLLGTIKLQDIDRVDNLPLWGSINRACYTSLLHNDGPKASVTIEKTTKNRSKDCYTRLLHNVPSGLCVRSGRFYYRRRVPHDIRQLIGRAEIWRSLQTDSLKFALRRLHIEAEFEHARLRMGVDVDQALLQPVSIGYHSVSVPSIKPLKLSDAYERYMNDPTHSWSARTREAYETSRKLAVSVIGADMPLSDVSRLHLRDYIDVLRFLPKNATNRFPKLTAREAAAKARADGDENVMTAANANVCIANLSSFLNWAVNEELLDRNPVRGCQC